METKVCESCGEEFGCGAGSETCWCFDLEVSAAATAAIAEKYTQCLCPKCLGSAASSTAIEVAYPDGRTETIETAVRVDAQNYHEGMFDFYDERGNLLRQIEMGSGVTWEDDSSSKK